MNFYISVPFHLNNYHFPPYFRCPVTSNDIISSVVVAGFFGPGDRSAFTRIHLHITILKYFSKLPNTLIFRVSQNPIRSYIPPDITILLSA